MAKQKKGTQYRLLTEAEWEYAARAGTTTAYWRGDSATHEYANYGTDTTAGVGFASGQMDSYIAGWFIPGQSVWLYDINGNVLQWVEDCASDSYSNATADDSLYTTEDTLKIKEDIWSWMNEGSMLILNVPWRRCREIIHH